MSGDLISGGIGKHENGQPPIAQMFQTWMSDMEPVYKAGIKVYPVRGNHETYTKPFGPSGKRTLSHFLTPSKTTEKASPAATSLATAPSDAQWLTYSFQHKNAFIMGLDFYINGTGDDQTIPQSWIDAQLKGNNLPHVFVYAHPPIVQAFATPLGVDSIMPAVDTFYDSLVDAGCKMYFCGHDHFPQQGDAEQKRQAPVSIHKRNGRRQALSLVLGGLLHQRQLLEMRHLRATGRLLRILFWVQPW